MRYAIISIAMFTVCFSISFASAQNKVVVIPLNSSASNYGGVQIVTSATGRVWMDRNIGADRVAGSKSDLGSCGHYYQWGRPADDHEYSISPTTTITSAGDVPGHDSFIVDSADWRTTKNDNLWQGAAGKNNPCPDGFRLPTEGEWEGERSSWVSNNADGAFASNLKLPMPGWRNYWTPGDTVSVGLATCYWSSTTDGAMSRNLWIIQSDASMRSDERAFGCSVRCIRDK